MTGELVDPRSVVYWQKGHQIPERHIRAGVKPSPYTRVAFPSHAVPLNGCKFLLSMRGGEQLIKLLMGEGYIGRPYVNYNIRVAPMVHSKGGKGAAGYFITDDGELMLTRVTNWIEADLSITTKYIGSYIPIDVHGRVVYDISERILPMRGFENVVTSIQSMLGPGGCIEDRLVRGNEEVLSSGHLIYLLMASPAYVIQGLESILHNLATSISSFRVSYSEQVSGRYHTTAEYISALDYIRDNDFPRYMKQRAKHTRPVLEYFRNNGL